MDKNMDKKMADAVQEMYEQGIEMVEEADTLESYALDRSSYKDLDNAKKLKAEGELLIQSARLIMGD